MSAPHHQISSQNPTNSLQLAASNLHSAANSLHPAARATSVAPQLPNNQHVGGHTSMQYDSALDSSSDTTLNTIYRCPRSLTNGPTVNLGSPAVKPKPVIHNNGIAVGMQPMPSAVNCQNMQMQQHNNFRPQPHMSCDAIYGHHGQHLRPTMFNNGINAGNRILAGNQSPALSAISEPIYAHMPRNVDPSINSAIKSSSINVKSEVPMLEAIKCDSMYTAASLTGSGHNSNSNTNETDKLLQHNHA